jgi:hypothetical protein
MESRCRTALAVIVVTLASDAANAMDGKGTDNKAAKGRLEADLGKR